MPSRPKQRCNVGGCSEFAPCPDHSPKPWAGSNRRAELGPRWSSTAARIIARDPVCRCPSCPKCSPSGCTRPSTDADHQDDPLDHTDHNLEGRCHPCHDQHTQQQARNATRKRTQ